ncbi:MAG: hypothetical protein RJA49_241 [Actinomycetota bacterium]
MSNDPSTTALSPRAGIAMLTLQLRSALQEAEMLETTDHTIDEDAARRQLRERLDPLLEDRRREYAAALADARADAAAAIDQARAEAEQRRIDARLAAQAALVAEAERLAAEHGDTELATPMSTVPATIARPAAQEVIVSIDADAFARVFATVFAALLEQRGYAQLGTAPQMGAPQYPQHVTYAPAPTPVQPRQSFWSHALHPDVLLMGLATVIVLVVLAAWLV